ncbi:hypothetical protein ABZP36_011547 [Zizania latifolia]
MASEGVVAGVGAQGDRMRGGGLAERPRTLGYTSGADRLSLAPPDTSTIATSSVATQYSYYTASARSLARTHATSSKNIGDSCRPQQQQKQQTWRRRDVPATTMVYVVHPSEFRSVVQQLTGDGSAAAQQHRIFAAETNTNRRSSMATPTLRQMCEECMAWTEDH